MADQDSGFDRDVDEHEPSEEELDTVTNVDVD